MPGWLAIPFLITLALVALALLGTSIAQAGELDELQTYAQECDQAIGVENTVPDFDCDASTCLPGRPCDPGTKVLKQGDVFAPGATCDEPNRLKRQCDPGSHFKVLTRSDDAYVVANCRKEGNDSGKYGDIAVIQYNRKNGATCFYQSILMKGLPGHVQAPSKGLSAWKYWETPSGTAGGRCGGCHDNGPFIRSPYLNQIKAPDLNALPGSDYNEESGGSGVDGFNFNSDIKGTNKGRTWLYAFVGKDFDKWMAFKVDAGNECTSCHRLGVNNVTSGQGTALDFAERATSASEDSELTDTSSVKNPSHKNPPSAASPMWMRPVPVQVVPNPAHVKSAKAIHDCALRYHVCPGPNCPANYVLPSEPTCRITLFASAYVPISKPISMAPIYYYLLND